MKTPHWLMLVTVLTTITGPASAETTRVQVTRVIDGDTVVAIDESRQEIRVRLAGIDCPEKRRKQPFWRFAKEQLSERVGASVVDVEWDKRDRWGRYIGVLWHNGRDVNAELVGIGACWHFKRYESEQSEADQVLYSWLETEAQRQGLGLWIDGAAVAPWDWRKKQK